MSFEMELKNPKVVEKLNNVACAQTFPLWVSYKGVMVDARSILGVLSLIGKRVKIVAPDHLDAREFIGVASQF